jgi:hypothetical protein
MSGKADLSGFRVGHAGAECPGLAWQNEQATGVGTSWSAGSADLVRGAVQQMGKLSRHRSCSRRSLLRQWVRPSAFRRPPASAGDYKPDIGRSPMAAAEPTLQRINQARTRVVHCCVARGFSVTCAGSADAPTVAPHAIASVPFVAQERGYEMRPEDKPVETKKGPWPF